MGRRLPWNLIVGIALVPLVLVLAVLQYRWTGEVSRVEATRMQSYLLSATSGLREDLGLELDALATGLTAEAPSLDSGDWGSFAASVATYRGRSRFPKLVSGITLLQAKEDGNWTARDWSFDAELFGEAHEPSGELSSLADPEPVEGVHAVGERLYITTRPARTVAAVDSADGQTRILRVVSSSATCLVLEVDVPQLVDRLLPLLVAARFGASLSEYVVAVQSPSGHAYVYSTDSSDPPATPDVSVPLFDDPATDSAMGFAMGTGLSFSSSQAPSFRVTSRVEEGLYGTQSRMVRTYIMTPRAVDLSLVRSGVVMVTSSMALDQWLLLAAHRSGSLGAAVAKARGLNLAVSLGIVLVLAAAVVLLARALSRSQELARRERELVASVSHELKTPLGVILAVGENLESGIVAGEERVREYGSRIGTEGARLREMIEKILSFSRLGGGRPGGDRAEGRRAETMERPEQIDPEGVVGEAMVRVLAASGSRGPYAPIERVGRAEGCRVRCDRSALLSIVENLLTNARIHGLPASGPITVESAAGRWRGRPAWVLDVSDQGPGIPRRERRKVFEPFVRGERALSEQVPGSGLGLHIARRQASSCGGELELCPGRGKGTRVRLSLPLYSAIRPRD